VNTLDRRLRNLSGRPLVSAQARQAVERPGSRSPLDQVHIQVLVQLVPKGRKLIRPARPDHLRLLARTISIFSSRTSVVRWISGDTCLEMSSSLGKSTMRRWINSSDTMLRGVSRSLS
jgi:hypothetical protein